MLDQTKMLLLISFSLLVLVLVSNGRRPAADTPISGAEPVSDASQSPNAQTEIAPSWAVNVPTQLPPPLSLMIPVVGTAPDGECYDD